MCGIAGIVHLTSDAPVDPAIVRAMTATMVHRGPDDAGEYFHRNVGFGFRRLSILDVAGGHQPLANEDGTIWIVFNGEIYNFPDLRRELEAHGHAFKTRTDSEAIVHAYEEWGADCVRHLRGMFAFAIHDQRNDVIFAARDRFGIKPFYYAFDRGTFVFASELKPLIVSGLVPVALNPATVESFVSVGYVPGTESLLAGVHRLPPAHTLMLHQGQLRLRRYWDFSNIPKRAGTEAELVGQLEERLREAVKIHLLSDVPLGVFLSGGVDSSALVAFMSEVTNQPIRTFSVGYADAPEVSELSYARQVANQFHTTHQEFVLESGNFLKTLEDMTAMFAEPVVEAPGIALYHIAKCAKANVTVALSGEGSDEIFGGYSLYNTFSKIKHANSQWRLLRPLADALRRHVTNEKLRKYLDWFTTDTAQAYRGTSYDVTPSIRAEIFNPDFVGRNGAYLAEVFHEHFRRVAYQDTITQLTYVDAQTWMVDDILTKSDRMTMAASIECRVPFLDHKLVEFATSLPSEYRIRRGTGKYLLKRALASRLPREIIYRKKRGFPIPLRQWFQRDLFDQVESVLSSTKFRNRGYFNPAYVDRILREHRAGKQDFSRRLLTFYIFELWHQSLLDTP